MKSKIYVLFFMFLLSYGSQSSAAGPYVHIQLAEKFISHYQVKNRRLFLVGTLFPDIRYLGKISRDQTHFKGIGLKEIIEEKSDFIAGMKLHSFVDEIREKFTVTSGIYDYIKRLEPQHHATLLKLIEDEILWKKQLTSTLVNYLAETSKQEIEFSVPFDMVIKWHLYLSSYFNQQPGIMIKDLAKKNSSLFNIPAKNIINWSKEWDNLVNDKKMLQYVSSLDQHFTQVFSNSYSK